MPACSQIKHLQLLTKFTMKKLKQEIALLQKKLQIAEKALKEIAEWDDDLEEEWGDPGHRAIECLIEMKETIKRDESNSTIITFKQFETAIKDLKAFFQEQQKLDAVLKVISPSGTGVCEFGNEFIDAFIRLGEAGLKDECNFLSWFVFDNDFGKKELKAILNENEYVITNEKDFYDFMVKLSSAIQ